MKTLGLLCLLLIPAFAAAEMGSWTLYYCETETVDGSGNLVVTPTVSITGNDGGNFCDPQSCNGLEQAFVMLNGNAWQAGYTVNAGLSNPSQVYTFPNVTIAPGASADLSYAGKVEGTIQLNGNDYWTSPNMIAFYQTAFEEGNGVYAPSPCWINGYEGNSPACEGTWPAPWALPIRGWATYDLDSQQVAQLLPGVTISGPTNVPMLAAGAQGSDSVTLTANPNPSGGTFQWTILSGASNITLLNDTSQSSIVQSTAVGTFTVQVAYTYDGWMSTAVAVGKVQQPASLSVPAGGDTGFVYDFNCRNTAPDYPPYTSGTRRITYQVLDTGTQPIPAAGMSASESFSPGSNGCVHTDYPTAGRPVATASDGTFGPDTLGHLCSISCLPADSSDHPLGSCSLAVQQTWSVNGFNVQTKNVTYTCQAVTLQ